MKFECVLLRAEWSDDVRQVSILQFGIGRHQAHWWTVLRIRRERTGARWQWSGIILGFEV